MDGYSREKALILGKCQVQTAVDRFGPQARCAMRDRERVAVGLAPMGSDDPVTWPGQTPDEEAEHAQDASIYYVLPKTQTHRNNLTAFAQTCNLYFAAYQGRIFVYRPRANPTHLLPMCPDLQLAPQISAVGESVSGYIDMQAPHIVNHIVTGSLGEREVVVAAYDNGEVVAYDVKGILAEVSRLDRLRSQAASTGRPKTRQPLASLRPFLHENVGHSAWGLAIHARSRLIAVSSNLHEVMIFALALSPCEGNPNNRNFSATCEAYGESLDAHVRQRARTWRIVIALDESTQNLPNISFLDDEYGYAEKICGMDIAGVVWTADIWESKQPVCRMLTAHEAHHAQARRGWGVIPMLTDNFLTVRTVHDLFGGDIGYPSASSIPRMIDVSPLLRNVWDDPCSSERHVARLPGRPSGSYIGPIGWSATSISGGNAGAPPNIVPPWGNNVTAPHNPVSGLMAAVAMYHNQMTAAGFTPGPGPPPSSAALMNALVSGTTVVGTNTTSLPEAAPGLENATNPVAEAIPVENADTIDNESNDEEENSEAQGNQGSEDEMELDDEDSDDDGEEAQPSNENEPPSFSANPGASTIPNMWLTIDNNADGFPVQANVSLTWSSQGSQAQTSTLGSNPLAAIQGNEGAPAFVTTAPWGGSLGASTNLDISSPFVGATSQVNTANSNQNSTIDQASPGPAGVPPDSGTVAGSSGGSADPLSLLSIDLRSLMEAISKRKEPTDESCREGISLMRASYRSHRSGCCDFPYNITSAGVVFSPLVYLLHQGRAQTPETFYKTLSRERHTTLRTDFEDPHFSTIARRYRFMTTYGNEMALFTPPPSRSRSGKFIPELRCTNLVPYGLSDLSRLERHMFFAAKRLSMLVQVPELSLLIIGSQTGRVVLVTPTRLAGSNLETVGESYEYGFRVEAILPLKSDEEKYRQIKRPLHGLAVGPAMYKSQDVADGSREAGPKRFRVVLHYTNHDIFTYEIGRAGDEDRLCIF